VGRVAVYPRRQFSMIVAPVLMWRPTDRQTWLIHKINMSSTMLFDYYEELFPVYEFGYQQKAMRRSGH
jgi:hypothetical protein